MTERLLGKQEASTKRDFLARSLEAQQKYPELVKDRIVRMWNIDNVFAGSDTTAVSLRAVGETLWRSWFETVVVLTQIDLLLPHAHTPRHGPTPKRNR